MSEQDRTRWDAALIREGVELITEALPRGAIGPYQLQAAVAALHDEAPSLEATDWPQIKALYGLLLRISDNPIVALNHAVAVGMADGPQAGLELLAAIQGDSRIAKDHRLHAVRAQFWEQAGEHQRAREAYEIAARLTASVPQQRYLRTRAARLIAEAENAP
jgi:predicted RNA polymerase sigma factor